MFFQVSSFLNFRFIWVLHVELNGCFDQKWSILGQIWKRVTASFGVGEMGEEDDKLRLIIICGPSLKKCVSNKFLLNNTLPTYFSLQFIKYAKQLCLLAVYHLYILVHIIILSYYIYVMVFNLGLFNVNQKQLIYRKYVFITCNMLCISIVHTLVKLLF